MESSPIHVIRLHAAWKRIELDESGVVLGEQSLSLPDTISLAPTTSHLVYRRNFNMPAGLNSSNRVYLDAQLLTVAVQVTLNEKLIELTNRSATLEVTTLLQPHNRIEIKVPASAMAIARVSTASLRIAMT